jgi:CO/xanthine dehydrogenase Mo-binding subunit
MTDTRVVGQSLQRIDAEEKVRGQAIFAADFRLNNELIGKFIPSPYAHAEILSIDTSKAEALSGVYAVITPDDIPDVPGYDPSSRFHAFMARKFVVFAGQPVAAVAAKDLATAEAALDLIEVQYHPLPVVSTPQQAIQPDSPLVMHDYRRTHSSGGSGHTQMTAVLSKESPVNEEEAPTNIADTNVFRHGDVEAAFAESYAIVENRYTVPVVHQGYIEPHAVTAHWDRPGHVSVWECVQGTFAARDMIARVLGIPQTSITLNSTEIGGGFGGKVEGIFAPIAVLLAKKAMRPVKLVLTRKEELMGSNPAPHSIIKVKTGAKKDGTLTAIEAEILVDAGAFPSGWIMSSITLTLRNSYKFIAWYMRGTEVLTNKASIAAYRAPGGPNVSFAIESQIDELARQLGMDPIAIRMNNLVQEGDPLTSMEPQVRTGAREVLDSLVASGSWPGSPLDNRDEEGWLHGRGVAMGGWDGSNGPASAIAVLDADGRFRIVLGTVDLTGSFTSLAQIAAEALGVSIDRVVMSKASPDYAPFAPMSAGSQTIFAMGPAVKEAATDLRCKLLQHAANSLGVSAEEVDFDDDGVFVASKPSSRLSFEMLFQSSTEWFATRGPLIGQGSAPLRKRAPSFSASVAEVAVDPETGYVKLTRLTTSQDAGKAINPALVKGQIQGGSVQSVGFALWEEVMYSEAGQILNPSLLDYHMATAVDLPAIEAIIVEVPGGDGPYGAKIVGEPSIIPPVAAIANAIRAAVGVRILDLPITPERIWRAVESGKQQQ